MSQEVFQHSLVAWNNYSLMSSSSASYNHLILLHQCFDISILRGSTLIFSILCNNNSIFSIDNISILVFWISNIIINNTLRNIISNTSIFRSSSSSAILWATSSAILWSFDHHHHQQYFELHHQQYFEQHHQQYFDLSIIIIFSNTSTFQPTTSSSILWSLDQ